MTLPSSGYISLGAVNQELGRPLTQYISLNDPDVRRLAGRPSGAILMSDLRGKSNIIREPTSGHLAQYRSSGWFPGVPASNNEIMWQGTRIGAVHFSIETFTSGIWTYYKEGNYVFNNAGGDIYYTGVYRTRFGP